MALLAHATDPEIAIRRKQRFVDVCTCSLEDEWELTAEKIQHWVRIVENEESDVDLKELDTSPFDQKLNQMSDYFNEQLLESDLSEEELREIEEATDIVAKRLFGNQPDANREEELVEEGKTLADIPPEELPINLDGNEGEEDTSIK